MNKSADQERAHFERFMADKIDSPQDLMRDETGDYAWFSADFMWKGWQARAQIQSAPDIAVFVVPGKKDAYGPALSNHRSYNQGYNKAIEDVLRLNAGRQALASDVLALIEALEAIEEWTPRYTAEGPLHLPREE